MGTLALDNVLEEQVCVAHAVVSAAVPGTLEHIAAEAQDQIFADSPAVGTAAAVAELAVDLY